MPKQEIVDVHEFPLHLMQRNVKIVAVGASRSGKSTLIEDIISVHAHHFPVGVFMSGSEDNNHAYAKHFPELFIYNECTEETLQNIHKRQKEIMNTKENANILVVNDDSSYDNKLFKKPIYQRYHKLGRHWQMMFLTSIQYCNDIPPTIKSNIDYTFIFNYPSEEDRKKIFRNYGGQIGDYTKFCDLLDQLEKYECLVIVGEPMINDKISHKFYTYKARLRNTVNFGCQEYKQWSEARFNIDFMKDL